MKPQFIETETYAIFTNLDASVLKLNPVIRDDGFEFVAISLTDLELNFSEVFNYPRRSVEPDLLISGDQPFFLNLISSDFRNILNRYFLIHPGNEDEFPDCEVFFLKKIENVFTERGDDYIMIGESITKEKDIRNYSIELIRKLRLIKKGNIFLLGCFSIFKKERRVISKNITYQIPVHGKYLIQEFDVEMLKKLSGFNFQIPEFLKLAVDSFELSYETTDPKLKFVLLMMGLESIFNKSSKDPISHILSRHVALLIAQSREEFNEYFKRIKTLYGTRCDIVHGSTNKTILNKLQKNILVELNELEDITRNVIFELLRLNDLDNVELDKGSLFDYLNVKGFEG